MDTSIEQWLPVPGYEHGYEVSNVGNVRSLFRKGKLLSPATGKYGYRHVVLYGIDGKTKGYGVHRLVAAAFIPNPDNLPWVNHKNGDKADNRLENLEWYTPSHNIKHAYNTGLLKPKKGEANGNCSFSNREWRVAKHLNEIGFSQYAIAEMFGTSQGTITRLLKQHRDSGSGS